MKSIKFAAILLSGVMAASLLMGCGGVNKNATVADFDDTKVSLGIANFAAKLQQAGYDDFYVAYFGEDVWTTDSLGNGTTMEQNLKDGVMTSLQTMYTLKAHADEYGIALSEDEKKTIKETAEQFISSNDKKALEALGAEQEIVEQYLTLAAIQEKVHKAIIAQADTDVSDEEANTSSYSYVKVSKTTYTDDEGNSAEYTEEEQKEIKKQVDDFAAKAKDGDFEAAAEENGYTVDEGTFTKEDENLNEAVLKELQALKEGGVSGVVDADTDYYVVRLDQKTDQEATEKTKESLISEKENAYYEETLNELKEKHTWTVNEKVWGKVKIQNLFTTTVKSTETEEPVESTE